MEDGNIQDILKYLKASSLFVELSEAELLQVSMQCSLVFLRPKEVLFSQGDPSKSIYILIEGQLVSFIHSRAPNPITIGSILPYELVGELGSLSGEARSLTVGAVSSATLVEMPSELFKMLCEKYSKLMPLVSKHIIHRSQKNIKLMDPKSQSYSVCIIYEFNKTKDSPILYEGLINALSVYTQPCIVTDKTSQSDLEKYINQCQQSGKKAILYLQEWNDYVIKSCLDKKTKFFLILHEGEKIQKDYFTTVIYPKITHHFHLRLELILVHPKTIKTIIDTHKYLQLASFHMHHHLRIDHDEDYQRIVRFMVSQAKLLVLGGGGAKGLVHLGVIQALLERKVPIDAIGGTSVGAAIGACYAYTLNLSRTMAYATHLKDAAIKSLSVIRLTWPIVSVFSGNPFTNTLRYLFNLTCIEDLLIPYFCVSANLATNHEKIHKEGFLWEALRASGSLPGMVPPVAINGQLLFDGGLVNNLPVDVMRSFADPDNFIIASSLSGQSGHTNYNFPSVLDIKKSLMYRLGLAYRDYKLPPFAETFRAALLMGSAAKEIANANISDIAIRPKVSDFKMLSIKKGHEPLLIKMGYTEALKHIDKSHDQLFDIR